MRDLYFHQPDSAQPGGSLLKQAACPSGVRLVLRTDASSLKLTTRPLSSGAPYDFDLRCDGELLQSVCRDPLETIQHGGDILKWRSAADVVNKLKPTADHVIQFNGIPAGTHVLEIWLSNVGPQIVRRLEVPSGSNIEMVQDRCVSE
jgi:hypothetical protein